MESVKLVATPRAGRGSQESRRLRRQGLVPAILYGHQQNPEPLTVSMEELVKAVRHGVRVFDLQQDKGTQNALLQEIQWDHIGREILHIDLLRVDRDERVEVHVPVELRGIAPGVTGGGVLDQPVHSLPIECPALSVPESIRVNVGELQLGQMIHVRQLTIPAGVKVLLDPEAVVVSVRSAAADTATAEATEQAEPELIGRQKAAEEEPEK